MHKRDKVRPNVMLADFMITDIEWKAHMPLGQRGNAPVQNDLPI